MIIYYISNNGENVIMRTIDSLEVLPHAKNVSRNYEDDVNEWNHIIVKDDTLPNNLVTHKLVINDNDILFVDKETKKKIRPKIIEHKVKDAKNK